MVFARVAQLVEHDLAKVGAAGSSPVSRSHRNTKKVSMWIPFFVFFEPNRGSKVRVTSFASLIGSDPPVSRLKIRDMETSISLIFMPRSHSCPEGVDNKST